MPGSVLPLPRNLLVYDGACLFCDRCVRFISERNLSDANAIYFISAQTAVATAELTATFPSVCRSLEGTGTIVLIETPNHGAAHGSRVYFKSEAAFRLLMKFDGSLWRFLGRACIALVPRIVGDAAYDFVAARRYRWFGAKVQGCAVPSRALRTRVWPQG